VPSRRCSLITRHRRDPYREWNPPARADEDGAGRDRRSVKDISELCTLVETAEDLERRVEANKLRRLGADVGGPIALRMFGQRAKQPTEQCVCGQYRAGLNECNPLRKEGAVQAPARKRCSLPSKLRGAPTATGLTGACRRGVAMSALHRPGALPSTTAIAQTARIAERL
jgi:hypothetical protein